MRITKPKLENLLLPILMLAFVGLSVTFLLSVFNTTTRWAVLAVVLAHLVFKGVLWHPFRTGFGMTTLLFGMWIVATVIWSELPLLTGMKSGVFLAIACTGIAGGYYWVSRHPADEALNYLMPLTAVALLAGLLGRYSSSVDLEADGITLYQGLVGGSNMYGSMLAMCSPLLIWQLYLRWPKFRSRALLLLVSTVGLYYLFAAGSRGAMLIVLCSSFGLLLSLASSRKVYLTVMMLGVFLIGSVLSPGLYEQFEQRYLYKFDSKEKGILYTREEVWQESYDQAMKGGVFGGGYGVTIGDNSFTVGFTAVGYGREKGNSQLAIVEETGLIGFGIYLASLFALFARLGRRLLRWPRRPEKVLLGIVTGTLLGMLVQSVFEAWWVAPGSPESVYFWTLCGVALGLDSLRLPPKEAVQMAAHNTGEGRLHSRVVRRPV